MEDELSPLWKNCNDAICRLLKAFESGETDMDDELDALAEAHLKLRNKQVAYMNSAPRFSSK
jgi:hypothetical protein